MGKRTRTPQAVVTRMRTLLRTAPRHRASLVDQDGVWFSLARLRELLVEDWPAAGSVVGVDMVEDVLRLLRRQGSAHRCRFYNRGTEAAPRWSHSNGGDFLLRAEGLWRWPARSEALDEWAAEKARAALEATGSAQGMPPEDRSRWCAQWIGRNRHDLDLLFSQIWRPAAHSIGGDHAGA